VAVIKDRVGNKLVMCHLCGKSERLQIHKP
jgi:hypothetical protein